MAAWILPPVELLLVSAWGPPARQVKATMPGSFSSRASHSLWVLLVIAGSAIAWGVDVRPPTPAELQRVTAHEATLVLLRVTQMVGGKTLPPSKQFDTNLTTRLYLASLDAHGAPARIYPFAPTKQAAAEGWRYLVLEPGDYFLLALPPGMEQNPPAAAYAARLGRYGRLTQYEFKPGRGAAWSPNLFGYVFNDAVPPDFVAIDGFRLANPAGGEVVYVGSLSVTCTAGRGLFGDLLDSCAALEVLDESAAASAMATQSFPGLAYRKQTLAPYGSLEPLAAQIDARTVIEVGGLAGVEPTAGTPAFRSPAVIPSTIPGVNVLNVIMLGGQLLHQSHANNEARQREEAMRPCTERLAAAVTGMDLSQRLASALKASIEAARGPAATPVVDQPEPPAKLRATVSSLNLREVGSPNKAALEVGVEIRLQRGEAQPPAALAILFSGPATLHDPNVPMSALYTTYVGRPPEPRALDEWCGPEGARIMTDEVNQALGRIADAVARGST